MLSTENRKCTLQEACLSLPRFGDHLRSNRGHESPRSRWSNMVNKIGQEQQMYTLKKSIALDAVSGNHELQGRIA